MSLDSSLYEAVIGLEVHAQLLTDSKIFCGDDASFTTEPNIHISPISLAYPGTLPRLNKKAVEFAIRLGLACHSRFPEYLFFDRKNYFYPDLPKGYQISQHNCPICLGGHVRIKLESEQREVKLHHIHLEEDAGKSLHDQHDQDTLLDFNRAGVALLEIVSEPDMHLPEEAYQYLTELRRLVRYLGICDGNMEEGSLRCDANISIRPRGSKILGPKVEIKNMNSIRNVKRAIEHEIERQITIFQQGGIIEQQTRSYDAQTGNTQEMRSKEMANDYRYLPDPDLSPLRLELSYINAVKSQLPSLPEERQMKYTSQWGLSAYDAGVLTEDIATADFFEAVCSCCQKHKAAANWIQGPVKSFLNERNMDIREFPITAQTLAELVDLVESGKLHFSTAASQLFPKLVEEPDASPARLAEALDLVQDKDSDSILPLVDSVIAAFPDKVAAYKKGKKALLGMFMGEVMKRSSGKADPQICKQLLEERLGNA